LVCLTLQVCICTTSVVKCLQSAWVTQVYSFRVVTATITTAFIRLPSVRYRPAAVFVYLTTKTLLGCSHSLSRMAMRLCLSSQRCVPYGWVLWKAGVPSTTGRMSPAHHAGLKSTLTDHFTGLTKCWPRWVRHTIQSRQCRRRTSFMPVSDSCHSYYALLYYVFSVLCYCLAQCPYFIYKLSRLLVGLKIFWCMYGNMQRFVCMHMYLQYTGWAKNFFKNLVILVYDIERHSISKCWD